MILSTLMGYGFSLFSASGTLRITRGEPGQRSVFITGGSSTVEGYGEIRNGIGRLSDAFVHWVSQGWLCLREVVRVPPLLLG